MSAIAALSLANSVPANITFAPVKIDQAGVAIWADRSSGIALGYPVATTSLRSPTKTSRSYKMVTKLVVPVLEITSPSTATGIQPQPTKAFEIPFTITAVLPERASKAQCLDALALARSLFGNAVVTLAVGDKETVY